MGTGQVPSLQYSLLYSQSGGVTIDSGSAAKSYLCESCGVHVG